MPQTWPIEVASCQPPWLWSNLWGKNGSPMWRSCDSRFVWWKTTIGDRPSSWVDHGNWQFLKIWVPPNPHKSTASPFSPYFNHQDRVVFPGCRWSSRFINFQAPHFSYTLPIWVLSCLIQIFRHTQIFRNEIPWDSLWNRLSLGCILRWIGSREILPPTKDLVGGFNMSQVCSKYGNWSQETVIWNQQPAMIGPYWTWISMFFPKSISDAWVLV